MRTDIERYVKEQDIKLLGIMSSALHDTVIVITERYSFFQFNIDVSYWRQGKLEPIDTFMCNKEAFKYAGALV